jgi:hypothetical protein
MKNAGIGLIVIGIVMLVWSGFTYTTRENVVDMGPLQVNVDKKERVNFPPYVGAIVAVIGIVLVVSDKRRA